MATTNKELIQSIIQADKEIIPNKVETLESVEFDSVLDEFNLVFDKYTKKDPSEEYMSKISNKIEDMIDSINKSEENEINSLINTFNNIETEGQKIAKDKMLSKAEIKKDKKDKKDKKPKNKQTKEGTAITVNDNKETQVAPTNSILNKDNKEEIIEDEDLQILNDKYSTVFQALNNLLHKASALEGLKNDLYRISSLKEWFTYDNKTYAIKSKKLNKYIHQMDSRKTFADITWCKEVSDQSPKCTVNDNILYAKSTSCYNWFRTNEWFDSNSGTDVSITYEIKIENSSMMNNLIYIGVQNENIKYISNCMCCNIENCIYFKRNGDVVNNKIINKNLELSYSTLPSAIVTVNLSTANKEVSFKVNNNPQSESYYFTKGERFRFIIGCCNTGNFTAEIIDSSYI